MDVTPQLKTFYALYLRAGRNVNNIRESALQLLLGVGGEQARQWLSEQAFPWRELDVGLAEARQRLRSGDIETMPDADIYDAVLSMRDEELIELGDEQFAKLAKRLHDGRRPNAR